MTTENFPTARDAIIRETFIVEDVEAVEAENSPLLREDGNPILDEKGRGIYDDQ